jgi:hypothetical protein
MRKIKLVARLLPPREISVASPLIEILIFEMNVGKRTLVFYGPLKAMPTSTGCMAAELQRQLLPFF